MNNLNDALLNATLKKNFQRLFQTIINNGVDYEANIILRINFSKPPSSTLNIPDVPDKKQEIRGIYIRLDIRDVETVGRIVSELRRDKAPLEVLAIIKSEDNPNEVHVPLE